jgi:cysteine synthase
MIETIEKPRLPRPVRARKLVQVGRGSPSPLTRRPGALAAIGGTPLTELQRVRPASGARILLKLEYLNPTGSMKDRLALAMIEGAEQDGLLTPDTTVVEYTGGSTGPGLALVCAVKGYRLKIVTSTCFSQEPQRLMRALGAELILLPAKVQQGTVTPADIAGMVERASELAELPNHYFTDQFRNPYVIDGLYSGLGREITDAVGSSITAFCTGVGSSASLQGVARSVREANPEALIVALEPAGSAAISGGPSGPFKIQGWSGFIPPLYEPDVVDQVIPVDDRDALETTLRLARDEGVFTGVSGGANVAAAIQLAEQLGPDDVVVTLAPDSGYKYLSAAPFLIERGVQTPARPGEALRR